MDLLYDAADDYDDPFDFPFKIDDFQPLYVTSAKSISVEEDQGDDQSLSSVLHSKKLEKTTDETALERKASIVYADRKSFIYGYEEEEYSSGEADSEVQEEIEEEKKVEEAEGGAEEADEAEEAEEIFLKGDRRGFALGYGYDVSTLRLSEEERRDIVSQLKSLAEDAQVGLAQNKFLHKQYIGTIRNAQVLAEALDRFDEVIVYESSRYVAASNSSNSKAIIFLSSTSSIQVQRHVGELHELSGRERGPEGVARRRSAEAEGEVRLGERASRADARRPDRSAARGGAQNEAPGHEEQGRLARDREQEHREPEAEDRARRRNPTGLLQDPDSARRYAGPAEGARPTGRRILRHRLRVHAQTEGGLRREEEGAGGTDSRIVKNLEEEVDLDQEKIEKIRENLDCLLASNVSEHYEAATYGKQRSLIQMKTLKMQEVIGLLDKPHLLNKMAASLREIQCLKDKSEIIQLQIYSDAIRHALLL
ncbi:unnamed protein product [Trichogramma brassicae]|uniref:Uncharacterized protein n=1 Tax=Trichogramma brassicae TaxID=86971 RepID=A0A6H5I409_9HYME|nr:unnamed protein product [Trichogramma brassicae]